MWSSSYSRGKHKQLKYGEEATYIYYHCTRTVDYDCDEPYITEQDLIAQLLNLLPKIKIDEAKITKQIKNDIERFHKLRSEVLHQEYLSGNLEEFELSAVKPENTKMAKTYLEHILKTGSTSDRQQILSCLKTKFILKDRILETC